MRSGRSSRDSAALDIRSLLCDAIDMPVDMKIKIGGMADEGDECECGDCYECGAIDFRDKAIALIGMNPITKGDPKTVQAEVVKLLDRIPCGKRNSSTPPSKPSGAGMMGDMEEED